MRFLILLVTLFTLESQAESSWTTFRIQSGCKLFRGVEAPAIFPGNECLFFSDGSFVSADHKALRMFSPRKEVVWTIPGHFHHHLNYSHDRERILALSSDLANVNGKTIRNDALLVVSRSGALISRVELLPFLRKAGKIPMNWPVNFGLAGIKADMETSHFNSVHEIPENASEKKIPWMRRGNIILNSLTLGFFVFSPDFKTLIHHQTFPMSQSHTVHDVQATVDGSLLFFNNSVHSNEKGSPFSAVQKVDPATSRVVWSFSASPKEVFYSPFCGSAQELKDAYFFSHALTGGFLFSKKDHKVIAAYPKRPGNPQRIDPVFQMKLVDVEDFFRNSK